LCGISRDVSIGGVGAIKENLEGCSPSTAAGGLIKCHSVIFIFPFHFKLSTTIFFLLPCVILQNVYLPANIILSNFTIFTAQYITKNVLFRNQKIYFSFFNTDFRKFSNSGLFECNNIHYST
jgi:hypothetical protein